jgi:hypothetical protein
MHRSGTRLATRVLQDLGLFVGRDLDGSNESGFFVALNKWAIQEAGTHWDNPEPVERLLEDDEVRDLVTERWEAVIESPRLARYLGLRRWLTTRSLSDWGRAWGWKDPRNSLLLPLWLEVFPDARVLHVKRHGVDVADSLARRCRDLLEASTARPRDQGLGLTEALRTARREALDPPLVGSLRARDPADAFDLWARYLDLLESHLEDAEAPHREVRFEDILARPRKTTRDLADFAGLEADEDVLDGIEDHVDPSRAYAFADDPDLRAVAEDGADALRRHGYEPDPAAD